MGVYIGVPIFWETTIWAPRLVWGSIFGSLDPKGEGSSARIELLDASHVGLSTSHGPHVGFRALGIGFKVLGLGYIFIYEGFPKLGVLLGGPFN